MDNKVTQQAIDEAAQRRIRVVTNLDIVINQAKTAKKAVGTAGGNRRIRTHLAAIRRQLDELDNEFNAEGAAS